MTAALERWLLLLGAGVICWAALRLWRAHVERVYLERLYQMDAGER